MATGPLTITAQDIKPGRRVVWLRPGHDVVEASVWSRGPTPKSVWLVVPDPVNPNRNICLEAEMKDLRSVALGGL